MIISNGNRVSVNKYELRISGLLHTYNIFKLIFKCATNHIDYINDSLRSFQFCHMINIYYKFVQRLLTNLKSIGVINNF